MTTVLLLALVLLSCALIVVLRLLWQQMKAVPKSADPKQLAAISQRASERLSFRSPTLDDADFFETMTTDPTAAEANGWDHTEADFVRARFADTESFKKYQHTELVAVERATGTAVGTATFSATSAAYPGTRSVGVHVRDTHRNQGYGREIMAAALLYLQTSPDPIVVGTRVTNLGMQRIMEQLGYTREPDVRPFVARNGQAYDSYWYRCGADIHPPRGLHE